MTNREYKELLRENYKSQREEKIGIRILSKEEVEELKKKGIMKDERLTIKSQLGNKIF